MPARPLLTACGGWLQNAEGAILGPFDCWLALRGLKTMALRMERQVPPPCGLLELQIANLFPHALLTRPVLPTCSAGS